MRAEVGKNTTNNEARLWRTRDLIATLFPSVGFGFSLQKTSVVVRWSKGEIGNHFVYHEGGGEIDAVYLHQGMQLGKQC